MAGNADPVDARALDIIWRTVDRRGERYRTNGKIACS